MDWRPTVDQLSHSSQTSVHELSNCSKMVSVLHFKKSLPNRTYKVLNQLFSWQRLRKVKSIDLDAINNVCVILKSEQSTRTLSQTRNHSMTESFHSQTSVTPAVSFINRGEGLVSMQLMDRIMINDNQLYSMGLSQLGFDHKNELNTATLELSTRALNTDYVSPSYSSSLKDQQWFYGWIDRQNAIKLLNNRPIGSFIVRHSTTDPNCFALTIRVPNDYQMTGIAHYLISATDNRFRIKGFTKEFKSLESLLVHHSIMKELLPCPLLLPNKEFSLIRDQQMIPSLELRSKQIDDTLVDIDSDPNYHKVLVKFRKTMYQIIS